MFQKDPSEPAWRCSAKSRPAGKGTLFAALREVGGEAGGISRSCERQEIAGLGGLMEPEWTVEGAPESTPVGLGLGGNCNQDRKSRQSGTLGKKKNLNCWVCEDPSVELRPFCMT